MYHPAHVAPYSPPILTIQISAEKEGTLGEWKGALRGFYEAASGKEYQDAFLVLRQWPGVGGKTLRELEERRKAYYEGRGLQPQSCKSPEGIVVGLVDSLIAVANILATLDQSDPSVQEAIADLRSNESMQSLMGIQP